jgi:hypothetical protein
MADNRKGMAVRDVHCLGVSDALCCQSERAALTGDSWIKTTSIGFVAVAFGTALTGTAG